MFLFVFEIYVQISQSRFNKNKNRLIVCMIQDICKCVSTITAKYLI